MSKTVLVKDLIGAYCRENYIGEIRDFTLHNTYNPETMSIELEIVDTEYLLELATNLKINIRLNDKDAKYLARFIEDHPILKDHIIEKQEEEEVENKDLLPGQDTYPESVEDRFDSPTYGDLQSPAAETLRASIERGEQPL